MKSIALCLSLLLPALCAQPPENPPAGKAVSELVLSGQYEDLPQISLNLSTLLLGAKGLKVKPFFGLVEELDRLAGKKPGGELLVDLSDQDLGLNLVQIAELERAFNRVRQAGIKITAYLENTDLIHYLAACLCDRILMGDMGALDFHAPALNILFLKDVLDLLGIHFQVTRAGRFKGAVEPYVRSSMSPHLRLQYLALLRSLNGGIVDLVARHRNLTAKQILALQEKRLLSPEQAREAGLVDALVPFAGARQAFGKKGITFKALRKIKPKQAFNLFSFFTFGLAKRPLLRKPSIVVLHLSGTIVDGSTTSSGEIVSGPTVKLIRKLARNPLVKGVVVRVNSPGGSATASEAILLALRTLAQSKPMVVSMGRVAASGGYYVSMAKVPVLAEHDTITGSIGVFGLRPEVSALARRIGINNERVALHDSSRLDDLFTPLDEEELKTIQLMVDRTYRRFQDRVLEARHMKREALLEIAGGRVWSGAQALKLGLVDELGGLEAAANRIRSKLEEKSLPLVHLPRSASSPLEMVKNLIGGLKLAAPSRLALLSRAGFRLQAPLQLLLDALQHPSPARVWALLPGELLIR